MRRNGARANIGGSATSATAMHRPPQPAANPLHDTAGRRSAGALAMLVAGLVLVGVNLRPALSSLSPVLKQVAAGTGLSGATAGLLTTLPVVCLGVFAPAAAVLARRFGAERTVGGLLIVLALGIALRSAGGIVALFAGTLAAGACIGVTGILLPGIIKRDFGRQADLMTGAYTMALCLGAAVAAGSPRWRSGRYPPCSPSPAGGRTCAIRMPAAQPRASSASPCGGSRSRGRSCCTWGCNRGWWWPCRSWSS